MTHPAVHPDTPRAAVASGCVLGEGPVWDQRTGTLLWVVIKNPAVWCYEPKTYRKIVVLGNSVELGG